MINKLKSRFKGFQKITINIFLLQGIAIFTFIFIFLIIEICLRIWGRLFKINFKDYLFKAGIIWPYNAYPFRVCVPYGKHHLYCKISHILEGIADIHRDENLFYSKIRN